MPDAPATRRALADLRGPERRFLAMLRLWPLWPEAQACLWGDLAAELGAPRARACLSAFEDLSARLSRAAWQPLRLNAPTDPALSEDEDALCLIVMLATEGARDEAMLHASFLVRADALLPILLSAERTGLPLLCAECRARLRVGRGAAH